MYGKVEAIRYRTIWISHVHLGTRGCQGDYLLDFLRSSESEYLYLVGDIVDGWRLRKSWYWPQSHNDEVLRDYAGVHFGGVDVAPEIVHVTADGHRLLIMHGDQFDGVVQYAKWLAYLGDRAYNLALAIKRDDCRDYAMTFSWRRCAEQFLEHLAPNA